MNKKYKYHAYLQGDNKFADYKNKLDAITHKIIYNLIHWLKRDGKKICVYHQYQ